MLETVINYLGNSLETLGNSDPNLLETLGNSLETVNM